MNLLYVHKNWKDEVALQKALVGLFVQYDDVPSVQDPVMLTREELMEKVRMLEEKVIVLKDEKSVMTNFVQHSQHDGKVTFVDDSFLEPDLSDSSPIVSDFTSRTSAKILKKQKKTTKAILIG